jgi:hypothetical protein
MQTWIFQGNPDHFDIDGYLATWPTQFPWLVTKYANDIQVGDRVFLWRNQGKHKAIPGIIAEARIVSSVEPRPESSDGQPFWRVPQPATDIRPRVLLRLVRVATKREVLRREWLEEDPVLRDLPNLKLAAGTNYIIPSEQALRLTALWNRTGQDWSRDESVAGLWAYVQTYGGPVSRVPESPVAAVAMLSGRPVAGVYNKVMNFRALDPRDSRAGLSAGGATDERVWSEFFDRATGQLDHSAIEQEFTRLWGSPDEPAKPSSSIELPREIFEATARRLEDESLQALLDRYDAARRAGVSKPKTSTSMARVFERDPLVVAVARKRAKHCCEVPGCSHPTFITVDGLPYNEVHHIVPMSEGGDDTIENVACLCPTHHREAHLGRARDALAEELRRVRELGRISHKLPGAAE